MPKQPVMIGVVVVGIVALLIGGYAYMTGPHGRLIAQMQMNDTGGFPHLVTVRQYSGRFRTELEDVGNHGRILPVSSYEIYEGSSPIKSATITWPTLHQFSVAFDNGTTLDCSWSETNAVWTAH